VVIYNNQNSGYELYEAVHAHYELKLVGSLTFGYEIWVFKRGWFQLVGGFQNWGFVGCATRNGNRVAFCDQS